MSAGAPPSFLPQPCCSRAPSSSFVLWGSPAPRAGGAVGGGCVSRVGGVLTPPALQERVGGWQLAASWARACASRSWHSCWHARQTPTATCSHPPTSAGAAGPSGFPGLPGPLPRAQKPPPQSSAPHCPPWSCLPAAAHSPGLTPAKLGELRRWSTGGPWGSCTAASWGREDWEADRTTDRVRAPPATWLCSSGTMAGSAVPGGNCRQTNLKR